MVFAHLFIVVAALAFIGLTTVWHARTLVAKTTPSTRRFDRARELDVISKFAKTFVFRRTHATRTQTLARITGLKIDVPRANQALAWSRYCGRAWW